MSDNGAIYAGDGTAEASSPHWRRRFLQLLLLAAGVWAVRYAHYALAPLQEAMRLERGFTDNEISWLQGAAVALPMAIGSIPLGLWVDRNPRAGLFTLTLLLGILVAFATAFVSSFAGFFATRALTGLTIAAVIIAGYSMVSDLYPPEQRGRASMVLGMGEVFAPPVAFAAGGYLLTVSGTSLLGFPVEGWRWVMVVMCLPLVALVLAMLALREPARTDIESVRPALRDAWPEFWRYRSVVFPLLLARVTIWIADGAVMVWAAPSFARTYGLSSAAIGAAMGTALLVSGILGPILGGPVADYCQRRGGPRRTVTALAVLSLLTVPPAFFALMPSATGAMIALTAFLTIGFSVGVAALAVGTIVIPGEFRGLFLALSVTVGAFFSIGVAPLAVSGLSAILGGPSRIPDALTVVCAVNSLLAGVVFWWGSRFYPVGPAARSSAKATS